MAFWAAAPAIISGVGALFGARSQSRAQREQARMQRDALDAKNRNYSARSPFRDAATRALSEQLPDAMNFFNPNAYQYRDSGTGMGEQTGVSINKANSAIDDAGQFDRASYIRDALKDFDAEAEPVFQAGARRVGQRAAQFGALGKGTINTELGELESRTRRERDTMQSRMLADAAGQTADDKFRVADLRGRSASDAFGRDQALYGRRFDEEGRRTGLARSAFDDRLRALSSNSASRSARNSEIGMFGGLGYGDDPSSMYQWASQEAGGRADRAGEGAGLSAEVLGEILAYLKSRPRTSSGRNVTDYGGTAV